MFFSSKFSSFAYGTKISNFFCSIQRAGYVHWVPSSKPFMYRINLHKANERVPGSNSSPFKKWKNRIENVLFAHESPAQKLSWREDRKTYVEKELLIWPFLHAPTFHGEAHRQRVNSTMIKLLWKSNSITQLTINFRIFKILEVCDETSRTKLNTLPMMLTLTLAQKKR